MLYEGIRNGGAHNKYRLEVVQITNHEGHSTAYACAASAGGYVITHWQKYFL